ncbi:MAG: AAA family ATPase [Chloroflexota bacterium]|nr:AAA family ATPase [Chloroflexota bacterium]
MAIALTLQELVELITSLATWSPLTMVAVDGPSGAGKSTLSRTLNGKLPDSQVVDLEFFYSDIGVDPPDGLSPEECYEQHVDWRALDTQVLRPLRRGEPGRYRLYDWNTGHRGDWVDVAPGGIVVIDGLYSMRPELMDVYDLTVYVDAPPGERLARLAKRPDNPIWVERWAVGFDWYIDRMRVKERADVVISGEP